jgi:hypothetical protein
VAEQLDEIVERLEPRFPVAAAMLAEAKTDVTAFECPLGHDAWTLAMSPASSSTSSGWAATRAAGETGPQV